MTDEPVWSTVTEAGELVEVRIGAGPDGQPCVISRFIHPDKGAVEIPMTAEQARAFARTLFRAADPAAE